MEPKAVVLKISALSDVPDEVWQKVTGGEIPNERTHTQT